MVQRAKVILEDDLDGGKAAETITVRLDGNWYEIDLSTRNASKLRRILAPYIQSGRRIKDPSRSRRPNGSNPSRDQIRSNGHTASSGSRTIVEPSAETVRAWAHSNGREVSNRGRISKKVRAAFKAANPN